MDLRDHIRQIPDFPKPGILFYDISTLLAHPGAWTETIERLAAIVGPLKPDRLLGVESRGFLVAAPLALRLGVGFVMLRKRGKLPGKIVAHEYDLEYGSDVIEMQADAISRGDRAVILDDLLATGGTMNAAVDLIRRQGADVMGTASIIELTFLKGRERLEVPFESLIAYDS